MWLRWLKKPMKPSCNDHDVVVSLSLEGMQDEALFVLVMTLQPLLGSWNPCYHNDDDDLVWSLTCVWKPLKNPLDPHTWWSKNLEGMLKVLC